MNQHLFVEIKVDFDFSTRALLALALLHKSEVKRRHIRLALRIIRQRLKPDGSLLLLFVWLLVDHQLRLIFLGRKFPQFDEYVFLRG